MAKFFSPFEVMVLTAAAIKKFTSVILTIVIVMEMIVVLLWRRLS